MYRVTGRDAGGTALEPHFDFDDVLALQVFGRKQWVLYPGSSQFESPCYNDKEWARQHRWMEPPMHDAITKSLSGGPVVIEMCPGDVLHVPRGMVHHTEALGDAGSMHITLGIDTGGTSVLSLLMLVMESVTRDEELLITLRDTLLRISFNNTGKIIIHK